MFTLSISTICIYIYISWCFPDGVEHTLILKIYKWSNNLRVPPIKSHLAEGPWVWTLAPHLWAWHFPSVAWIPCPWAPYVLARTGTIFDFSKRRRAGFDGFWQKAGFWWVELKHIKPYWNILKFMYQRQKNTILSPWSHVEIWQPLATACIPVPYADLGIYLAVFGRNRWRHTSMTIDCTTNAY